MLLAFSDDSQSKPPDHFIFSLWSLELKTWQLFDTWETSIYLRDAKPSFMISSIKKNKLYLLMRHFQIHRNISWYLWWCHLTTEAWTVPQKGVRSRRWPWGQQGHALTWAELFPVALSEGAGLGWGWRLGPDQSANNYPGKPWWWYGWDPVWPQSQNTLRAWHIGLKETWNSHFR